MKPFSFHRAHDAKDLKGAAHAKFLAGGTTLIDLMKLDVETPSALLDINALPYSSIETVAGGGVKIGATVRNSDLAHNPVIKKNYAVLSEALLAGASAQLRNKATTAGNLLQRTRCVYFRDTSKACNKREPGSGCSAIEGFNRNLAILGTSESCIASNPSDMNVAMMALEAKVHIENAGKKRDVEIGKFYLLPKNTPQHEFDLHPGDLITSVSLAPLPAGSKSLYFKLRDRASYEFALASAAIIAKIEGGVFKHIRIAMGGVGAIPWRAVEAEQALLGQKAEAKVFHLAAAAGLQNAKPASENAFKVDLAKKCLAYALRQVSQA